MWKAEWKPKNMCSAMPGCECWRFGFIGEFGDMEKFGAKQVEFGAGEVRERESVGVL
jgi:hypothetical protein